MTRVESRMMGRKRNSTKRALDWATMARKTVKMVKETEKKTVKTVKVKAKEKAKASAKASAKETVKEMEKAHPRNIYNLPDTVL